MHHSLARAVTTTDIPRFRRGFRFQWEPAQNGYVLLYPEGMVKLNESAGAILNEVDGQKSAQEMIEALETAFPRAGALENDVMEFLEHARQQHWIELS